jgi:hypothetical protein
MAKKPLKKKKGKRMGDCKDQMKPQTDKSKTLFGRVASKLKKSSPDNQAKAQTFADLLAESDDKLSDLIITKRAELANEKGREEYNRKALALLEMMSFHLDKVIENGAEYSELK